MTIKPGLLAWALAVAVVALPAEAQQTGAESAEAEQIAPHEMTCAQIRDMFLSEEMDEEASYLVAWAYGVRTGAKDLDFENHPVTMAGLQDFVTRLVLACQADPDKMFIAAILE